MAAQALATAGPEQTDHERHRQAEDDEAGDEGKRAGGRFHVVRSGSRQVVASGRGGSAFAAMAFYCTGQGLTLH